MERLDKILCHAGFGSRKDVKKLCHRGLVSVNSKIVTDCAFKIEIEKDELVIDGKKITLQKDIYIMMNKCKDVVCANKDGLHKTVFDFVPEDFFNKFFGGDLHCMGRLDIDTEGLLILTSDGKLTHTLLSPKNHVPKTYAVGLKNALTQEQKKEYQKIFKEGFWIDREQNEEGFVAQSADLFWILEDEDENAKLLGKALLQAINENSSGKSDCILTISEGKYHQVKRMFAQLKNEVVYLKRVKIGNLVLDSNLKPGECRELSEEEINLLSYTKN
ncbi:rRNA pseudouridine synthase [Treponema pectinovorum]|uniref:pseudouridine synthase n=1 Tax=Treponema pectinovorum TaxID=164 RepID=UPI003D8AEFE8